MIHYLIGDATQPVARPAIVAHVVNDRGVWGAGFVLAVSRRWREPELDYRKFRLGLGETMFTSVAQDIVVANMCAQGLGGHRPLNNWALEECLSQVAGEARADRVSVHMPRIGCGLAGGNWDEVGPIVERCMRGIEIYVYDLPTQAGTLEGP